MTNLRVLPEAKPRFEVKVDLDDRAFLFPSGKPVIQLVFLAEGRGIQIDASYPFNQARTPPRIATLDLADAKELGLKLVEVVHTAKSQLVVSESSHITISVLANGYRLQFGQRRATDRIPQSRRRPRPPDGSGRPGEPGPRRRGGPWVAA